MYVRSIYVVNELAKRSIAQYEGCEVHQLSLRDRLSAGAAAGLSYWVGTYPLDIVKVLNTNRNLRFANIFHTVFINTY